MHVVWRFYLPGTLPLRPDVHWFSTKEREPQDLGTKARPRVGSHRQQSLASTVARGIPGTGTIWGFVVTLAVLDGAQASAGAGQGASSGSG